MEKLAKDTLLEKSDAMCVTSFMFFYCETD
jgi:hypothetical protein